MEMIEAVAEDLRKVGFMALQIMQCTFLLYIHYNKCNSLQSKQEAVMLEINVVINDVRHALFHLKEWTEPEKVRNMTWFIDELLFLLFGPRTFF